jgi:transposase-like protein
LNVKECAVPAEIPEQTTEAVVVKKVRKKHHKVECPRCGGNHLKRKRREGFFQLRVFSAFGYYPWKCSKCGASFMLKKRGLPLRHQKHDVDAMKSGA